MRAVEPSDVPNVPPVHREMAWAAIVRPGDMLIVGLADTDNVNAVAKNMQTVLDPMGVKVVVLDNVQQMMIARPNGGDA